MSETGVRRRLLVFYFVLAYALSWAIEIPLAAVAQGLLDLRIPFVLHYLTAFGPLLAAFIVTAIGEGSDGVRDLVGRMVKWRVGLGWIFIAVFHRWSSLCLGQWRATL